MTSLVALRTTGD